MATISFINSEAKSDPDTSIDISGLSSGKYLFNDLYDSETIRNVIQKYRNTLFKMNLAVQRTICTNSVFFGSMRQFRRREYYNELEKLPITAYACEVPFNTVPYFSKKAYYDRYGGDAVSLIDIMHNDDIFARRCVCTIGDYVFLNLYMKPTSFGTILYIIPDKNAGLTEETILSMIDQGVKWSIRFEPQSPTAYTYKRKGLIFDENNTVPGSILEWTDTVDHRGINVWKSFMSSSRTDINLLCQANCKYDAENNQFVYSEEYLNHALSHIENCKVFLFNQKNFDGFSTLAKNDYDGNYYFRIPIEGRSPVPLENIHVYEYDVDDKRHLRLLSNEEINMTLHYPNVYTFTYDDVKTLRIEWDYVGERTYMNFNNVFAEYMAYVGDEVFLQQVLTGTLPKPYCNFEPSPEVHPSIKEFLAGEWESLDDYYVQQLIYILNENPGLYAKIMEDLLKPGKPDNDLVIKVPETPDIIDRITNNNSDAVTDPEDTEMWDELFYWVTISNPTDEPYDVTVTVDGKFTDVKHTYLKDGLQYIYIPADMVKDDSTIIITIHDCPKESQSGDILFSKVDSAIPLPPNLGDVASTSLLFYEKKTRQYLDISLIKFHLKAEIAYIPGTLEVSEEYADTIPQTMTSDGKGIITVDGKLFKTLSVRRVKDNSCYLLEKDRNALLTFYKQPLVLYEDYVVVPGPDLDDGFNKLLPSEDLELTTEEPALIGMRIGVVTTNVHRIYTWDDVRHTQTVSIPEFKLDPSPSRFKVYLNGALAVQDVDYIYTPQRLFADDAVFKLINQDYVTDNEPVKLIIEYLPTRRSMAYSGSDLIEFNEDRTRVMIDLEDVLTLPIMNGVTEIFINGILIPDSMIKVLENTRAVIDVADLEALGIDTREEMLITVFEETHDQDLYNYETVQGNTLNGEYMTADEEFKNWIMSL